MATKRSNWKNAFFDRFVSIGRFGVYPIKEKLSEKTNVCPKLFANMVCQFGLYYLKLSKVRYCIGEEYRPNLVF